MQITRIELVGDAGASYTITVDPVTKQARCSCPAFVHARAVAICKHITFVAQTMGVGGDVAPVRDLRRSSGRPYDGGGWEPGPSSVYGTPGWD